MSRNCLIIDDNLQDEVIESLENKLKNNYVNVQFRQFNIGSLERNDLFTDNKLDMGKIVEKFNQEFSGIKLDLICIDFNLDDSVINGLDVLEGIYPFRKTSTYMMYSSSLDQLVKKMIDGYNTDNNETKLLARIKFLTNCKIVDFVRREKYDDAVIKLMTKNSQSLEMTIEEKLLDHPDLVFENTYPPLAGKTLREIAMEIRQGSLLGNAYIKEIIEQAIANMILINS